MFQDGLPYWALLHDFYSKYVNIYYETDDHIKSDSELQDYWKFACVPQFAKSMPSLSKASLTDHITRVVFDVTAFHEFVGCVVSYTTDPAGASLQVRPGLDMCDLQ